jgi:hypothetical protein
MCIGKINTNGNNKMMKDNRLYTLLFALKNGYIKDWFYEFKHGHKFLLSEEVNIITKTRFDNKYKWMNDSQIQKLIQFRVNSMYKQKYPNAKQWTLPIFYCN